PELRNIDLLKEYRGHEYGTADTAEIDDAELDNPLNLPEFETTNARLARHTGTVIHSALQAIVENKLVTAHTCVDADEFIAQQHPFWKVQLQQLGWDGENLTAALQKSTAAIKNIINSETGRWILNSNHQQSACELSVIQKDQQ